MIFTISKIARSLADYFAPYFPGVKFYEDPNQQGTTCPCMFLQSRGATQIENKISDRYLRTVRLDLTYLVDYNLPNLQQQYQAAAEVLDEIFETFPYSDGTESSLVRTYNREWTIDLDALHYKFELQVFVHPEELGTPMQTLETNFDPELPYDPPQIWNYVLGEWELGDLPFMTGGSDE